MANEELNEAILFTISMLESLNGESDRGAILIVSALVENIVEEHIKKLFLPQADSSDELLSNSTSSPISTFSTKINLAYRLGLLSSNERIIFHQLRHLRNKCAHDIGQQNFNENHFRSRTQNIIHRSQSTWDTIMGGFIQYYEDQKFDSVTEFMNVFGWRRAFSLFFITIVAYKRIQLRNINQLQQLSFLRFA